MKEVQTVTDISMQYPRAAGGMMGPRNNWDGGPIGNGDNWNGWLDQHSESFDAGVLDLKGKLDSAFAALQLDPSQPALLAQYQTALQEYNMYRMMQSNSSKNLADMQKQNIRNLG
jgi:type III secretion protein F